MNEIKHFIIVVVAVLICPALSGCTSNEIDKKAIIDGILIEEGEYMFYLAGDEKKIEISENSLQNALNLLKLKTGKNVYLGQNKYVVFSENLSFEKTIQTIVMLSNNYQSSPNIRIVKANKDSIKYLKNEDFETDYIVNFARDSRYALYNVLNNCYSYYFDENSSNADNNYLTKIKVPLLTLNNGVLQASY